MNDKLIYEFDKGPGAKIRFTENRFQGVTYYHIRLFTQPEGDSNYYPTKKGISFNKDDIPSLLEALDAFKNYVLNGGDNDEEGSVFTEDMLEDLDGNP